MKGSRWQIVSVTALALMCFATNSLLCRLALKSAGMDGASFTAIRIVSGAVMLWLFQSLRNKGSRPTGSWLSAISLLVYAVGFSFAYVRAPAGVGALVLIGAVQITMIGYGLWSGEKLGLWPSIGLGVALAGLVNLLLPGLSAPPLESAILMGFSGVGWGAYSLRGRGSVDPVAATTGNFLRATPFAIILCAFFLPRLTVDRAGVCEAIFSGAITSGMGYILWYSVLPKLRATTASIVQLSVPVLTAAGGVALLHEQLTLRLAISSVAILGGIALVVSRPKPN